MKKTNNLVELVRSAVNKRINYIDELTDMEIMRYIKEEVFMKTSNVDISEKDKLVIVEKIFNSMRKLDILQPLIDDDSVTEIMVNGYENIFIERDGVLKQLNLKFESQEDFEKIIFNIVGSVNREVNESKPIVDARLKDGSRVNVVLPPIALNGPIMTIRKFPPKTLTMDKLVKLKTITNEAAYFLEKLVKAKFNIFILVELVRVKQHF